jgi:hypothetical protein
MLLNFQGMEKEKVALWAFRIFEEHTPTMEAIYHVREMEMPIRPYRFHPPFVSRVTLYPFPHSRHPSATAK